jgi:hypothetical protein
MSSPANCAHPGCRCTVPATRAAEGKDTCSEYCASRIAQGTKTSPRAPTGCGCGHPGCSLPEARL